MPITAYSIRNLLPELVSGIAQSDGEYATAIPELTIFRKSAPTAPTPCIYGLGLTITSQGNKQVTLGDKIINYGQGQSLVTATDVPVVSQITQASPDTPYLGLHLACDARIIAQIAADMEFPPTEGETSSRAIHVVKLDQGLLDSVIRLIRLLKEPELVSQLAPLIQREIMVRLLAGRHGPMLRRLVALGSPSQQIVKVMSWLKHNYTEQLAMDDLAARAHMSPSTFRQHFRAVASMSPLQYLKQLRLQEARQLMMHHGLDAGSAAVRVGYESASQFSREYRRLFGQPPQRDIRSMRETV